jgi:hypothetical protein
MALIAHDPSESPKSSGWWRELTGLVHDLFHSEEMRERQELLARARAERAARRTEPVAPEWLRLD